MKELTRGQPCDFSGIRDYAHIEAEGGIQWPYPALTHASSATACPTGDGVANEIASEINAVAPRPNPNPDGERRLFADGRFFTADERARFFFDAPRPMPEPPDAAYPLILLTGRGSSAQWHTGSRTDKSAILRKLAPTVLTPEIHPDDAIRLKITPGAAVRVRSRRGSADAIAFVTPTVQPGQVFLPMHFGTVNQLTFASFDPHSRQPSYKCCAVTVTAIP